MSWYALTILLRTCIISWKETSAFSTAIITLFMSRVAALQQVADLRRGVVVHLVHAVTALFSTSPKFMPSASLAGVHRR
jgi:hypothetical protein